MTTVIPPAPPEKTSQSAGASFFEVLAGTLSQAAPMFKGSSAATSRFAPQTEPEGSGAHNDGHESADSIEETNTSSSGYVIRSTAAPANPKRAAAPASPSQSQPQSAAQYVAQYTSRSAARPVAGTTLSAAPVLLSSTALAAKIAASIVLPQSSLAAPKSAVTTSQAAAAVPSTTAIASQPAPVASDASPTAAPAVPASTAQIPQLQPDSVASATPAAQSTIAADPAAAGSSASPVAHASTTIEASVTVPVAPAATTAPGTIASASTLRTLDSKPAPAPRTLNDSASAIPAEPPAGRNENSARVESIPQADSQASANKGAAAKTGTNSEADSQKQSGSAAAPANPAASQLPQSQITASAPDSTAILSEVGVNPFAGTATQTDSQSDSQSVNQPASSIKAVQPSPTAIGDSTPATSAAKNSPSVSISSDPSAHSSVAGSPPAQSALADASQPAGGAAKTTDAAATPIPLAQAGAAPHDATAARSQTGATPETPRATDRSPAPEPADAASTSRIDTARVMQSMSQSEMRVGMHSAEFGEISIRTSVTPQQMMAQISVDHGDLGKAISAHIPAMEQKLGGETGLRALVEVNQGAMSFSGERGYSSQREQKSNAAAAQSDGAQSSAEIDQQVLREGSRTATAPAGGYRLDIRA